MEANGLDKIFEGFDFRDIQIAIQINYHIQKNGVSWEQATKWTNDHVLAMEKPKNTIARAEKMARVLIKNDVSRKEMKKVLGVIRKERLMKGAIKYNRACPDCGANLAIYPVNHGPKWMVGGDYKCQWWCRNQIEQKDGSKIECGFSELSLLEIQDEIKPYLIDAFK